MKLILNSTRQERINEKYGDFEMLDLTGTVIHERKVELNSIVDENLIYPFALKSYQSFIDEIIQLKETLSWEISELELFWLTDTGVKNPLFHWGKEFFTLIEVLKTTKEFIEKSYSEIVLVLPKELASNRKNIIEYITCKLDFKINVSIEFVGKKSGVKRLSLLKNLIRSSLYFYQYKLFESSSEIGNYYLHACDNDEQNLFGLYSSINKLYKKNHSEIRQLPILEWTRNKKSIEVWPKVFLQNKPGFLSLIKLIVHCVFLHRKISKSKSQTIEIDNLKIELTFLKTDFQKLVQNKFPLILTHEWLKVVFSKCEKKIKCFYEDEFYAFGKTISNAALKAKNPFIETFGIQHGFFDRIHTVYNISDVELNHGYPKPLKYIVWGQFFKKVMQSSNSLNDDYFLVLGNPKFLELAIAKKNELVISQKLKWLWCLTSFECFKYEIEILRIWLKNQTNIELVIRTHPVYGISESSIKQELGSLHFRLDIEKSIFHSFQNFDLILCSAHSTVFLDALVARKPCIRLITNRWISNRMIDLNITEISTSKQLVKYIESISAKNLPKKLNVETTLLELEENSWRRFINENIF